jgi:Rad3-related DNA helicase
MDFLTKFDGSGRSPRQIQVDALTWLSNNWNKANVFVIQAPVGTGKSGIARAIQLATNGDIIPPTNQLINQYIETYPQVNSLKGKAHYMCGSTGMTCLDAHEILDPLEYKTCEYTIRREKADFVGTFFNPSSLFFYNLSRQDKLPKVLVVDEAHKIREVAMDMSGKSFNSRDFMIPKSRADINVSAWLDEAENNLRSKAKEFRKNDDNEKAAKLLAEADGIKFIAKGFLENPENYAIEVIQNRNRTRSLVIQPISPPRYITKQLLKADKLILLSATLIPDDVEELVGGKNFMYLDLPSPIPKENRKIIYKPAPHAMNTQTDPELIAAAINKTLEQYPGLNTIIHVTYGMAEKLYKYLPEGTLRNTSENKDEVINRFKLGGGIFLASGCSEGIDLPGDSCRLNIIPILFRLNPTDPVIRKRLGKPDGQIWYNNQVIKTLTQQAGRSTRGIDDHSTTVVLDPALPKLITNKYVTISQSLAQAIQWGT